VAQGFHGSYNDCLKEEATSYKMQRPSHDQPYCTHTAKTVAKTLRRRIEKKIEDVLGDQFGFRRGKGTRDAIGMVRIISERTLKTDEEICVCFVDWQKAFDRVNWTKLMQILMETSIDWRERILISNLYVA